MSLAIYKKQLRPIYEQEADMMNLSHSDEKQAIDILARTIFGEARGEGLKGQEAVASVIINRVQHAQKSKKQFQRGYWWGHDVVSVCLKPYQFSCWNADDPNAAYIQSIDEGHAVFEQCLRVARRAVKGLLIDLTQGATHYHTNAILPHWAKGQTPTVTIGDHVFYRLV